MRRTRITMRVVTTMLELSLAVVWLIAGFDSILEIAVFVLLADMGANNFAELLDMF